MNNLNSEVRAYETMLVIITGFLLLSVYLNLDWLVNVSVVIGVLSLLSIKLAIHIERGWNQIAKLLGYIVPNILLSTVFLFLLTPLAMLYRFSSKKDPLMLKRGHKSTFKSRDTVFSKETFEKQW